MKNNPTTIIKCKFSNEVHKLLEPNINIKNSERWKNIDKYKLTDAQKVELLNQILLLHSDCSNELTNYQYDKRYKKRIHKARLERGYKFKTKVKKEDYLNSLKKVA
jgi:hypothetical protein